MVELHLQFQDAGIVLTQHEFVQQVQGLSGTPLPTDAIVMLYGKIDPSVHPDLLTSGKINGPFSTETSAIPPPGTMLTSIDIANGQEHVAGHKNGFRNPDLREEERNASRGILGLSELPESKLFCYCIEPAEPGEGLSGKTIAEVLNDLRHYYRKKEDMPALLKARLLAHVQIY